MSQEAVVTSAPMNFAASQVIGSGHPPPSPLKFIREDSVDGTLSPVSSKSAGTDTDTDMRRKVLEDMSKAHYNLFCGRANLIIYRVSRSLCFTNRIYMFFFRAVQFGRALFGRHCVLVDILVNELADILFIVAVTIFKCMNNMMLNFYFLVRLYYRLG